MDTGNSRRWGAKLRELDRTFLACVVRVWWNAVDRLPNHATENEITMALVHNVLADAHARSQFYCEYQYVPFERTADGAIGGDNFVDMALIAGHERRVYLAYECKKLNVAHKDGSRRSQSERYVGSEGMMRFVTGKYARGMPVACMIGYVMDGDISFAYARIEAAIGQNRTALRLQDGPTEEPPLDAMARFVTTHQRNGDDIELRHALLPFVRAGS